MLLSGGVSLFEAIFFDTQKSWLTNGFTTLVGFQGTDLKIAGAVLYPNSSKKFPNHLILIVARRVSQTNACIWFIIRSRPGTPGTGENLCPHCSGTGKVESKACPECNGTGKVITGIGGG